MNRTRTRTRFLGCAALLSLPLLGLPLRAQAQTAPTPLADPASILTLDIENDSFSVPGTDRYYTSGERIGYVTPTGAVPDFIANLGHGLFGAGSQRMEYDLQQVIYTPVDTQVRDPDPYDRPYSGQLSADLTLVQDTGTMRSTFGASVGVVGPDSLAKQVQNGFHSIIGDTSAKGWHYQLHNEPTLDFYGSRTWRVPVAQVDDVGFELLPQVSGQVGNTEIYGQAGALFRFGQGLDSDYGPSIVQPASTGSDAYTPTRPFVWYIFGGALGRVVAHDMLVQGNDFRNSRGVALTPLQGDLEAGVAVILLGVKVSATEIFTTPEFHDAAPAFQYGAITVSGRF